MIKNKYIILMIFTMALMSSCNIYNSYERPNIDTKGLYRDEALKNDSIISDTNNFGNLPWKEVFQDPKLQILIEEGLKQNVNLQISILKIEEAKANLLASRLSFAPSFSLSPQGTLSSFDANSPSKTYQLPITASWEIDLFGNLRNIKEEAKANLLQTQAYSQAVKTQVISNIANCYYTLLMLDNQVEITEKTAKIWEENINTMKALKEAGLTNEAAVSQSQANYYLIKSSLPTLNQQIHETENSLSLILGKVSQKIERGTLKEQKLPETFSIGLPIEILSNRPDVKRAEMALMSAYYVKNQAISNFYPKIILNGSAGWTNNGGGSIVNPAKFLASAIGSLTQPLFNKGKNIAQLKISKSQQEEASLTFQQSILNAGNEVNNALFKYQTTNERCVQRNLQINSLINAVENTKQLMKFGSSTYIEILTAQQSLLNAQLSQVQDEFERIQAVISLYQALGGGR